MLKELRVLYVEDDSDISEEILYFLQNRVQELYFAEDGLEALKLFKKHKPDLIITDIQMPHLDGLAMAEKIREIDTDVAIVITSAYSDNNFLARSIDLTISGYLTKPINLKKLIQTAEKVCEPLLLKREIENKNRELLKINENLDALVKEKTKTLEHMYRHESVTDLYNITKLKESLEKEKYAYLTLLDISNFSVLNKQYGKEFADKVLKKTARVLETHVTKELVLFKAESDRFVFLVKNLEESFVISFCKQIIAFFDKTTLMIDINPIVVNFNIGISQILPGRFAMIDAEYALDKSKESGSRFFSFYSDEDTSYKEAKETIQWLNVTKDMIEHDKIEPYYQPMLDLKIDKITKYEVLARGSHKGKIVTPAHFLSSAERLGLTSAITRMMINKSFAFFRSYEYDFSINITQRDLLGDYLPEFLAIKLKQYNIDPSRVTFEVLESVTNVSVNHNILGKLLHLKQMGFKIAVDDFGVESSNFSRLSEMDFDFIKIDGQFIRNLLRSEKDITIVRSIVNLAKTLGIDTVAEYVENKEICRIIKECGVDSAQGYLIGRPQETLEVDFTCKGIE